MLKREERLENVVRIAKVNQYNAEKIKKKIELDKMRGDQIQEEKTQMLETRFAVRRQAEKQKLKLVHKVE